MAFYDFKENVGSDEILFVFRGEQGIGAGPLGDFLKAASRVASQNGAVLDIAAIERGSLIFRAKVRPKKTKNFQREANLATIVATAVGVASAVVGAAYTIHQSGKANSIEIFTANSATVIMDDQIAENSPPQHVKQARPVARAEVRQAMTEALEGSLIGTMFDVHGDMYFRPRDFKFMVPVWQEKPSGRLEDGARYVVRGYISVTKDGQPDTLVVHDFWMH